jgi:hypothetical protein
VSRVAGILAIAALTLAAGVVAAAAHPTRAHGHASVDRTFSCRVRRARYVDLYASVTLPPDQNQPRPGSATVTTRRTTIVRDGVPFNVPQILIGDTKPALQVDHSTCRASSQRIALGSHGLGAGETVTPTHLGSVTARCGTAKRVLVRYRITMRSGKPVQALIGLRNDDAKGRPVALYLWSPGKVTAHLGKSCVES